jgi:hypothetical protein
MAGLNTRKLSTGLRGGAARCHPWPLTPINRTHGLGSRRRTAARRGTHGLHMSGALGRTSWALVSPVRRSRSRPSATGSGSSTNSRPRAVCRSWSMPIKRSAGWACSRRRTSSMPAGAITSNVLARGPGSGSHRAHGGISVSGPTPAWYWSNNAPASRAAFSVSLARRSQRYSPFIKWRGTEAWDYCGSPVQTVWASCIPGWSADSARCTRRSSFQMH